MRTSLLLSAAVLSTLAGCATGPAPHDPERNNQTVSLVNSLTWTNAMTGKPDGLRSAWPLAAVAGNTEYFPLAQVKQCATPGSPCQWGVVSASRRIHKVEYLPGAVGLDVEVTVDVDRHQSMRRPGMDAAMTIPSDVSALRAKRTQRRAVALEYGKVHHLDFDFGIGFDLCVKRLDAAGKAVDECTLPYF